MKRAAIFHGTDGKSGDNWQAWLKEQLEALGFDVFAPTLPNNHKPNQKTYEDFLRSSSWDFTDNILIGHSSGATMVLNLLMSDWLPKVKAVVLVGTFLNQKLTQHAEWYESGQFDNLFLGNYDPQKLKYKTGHFYFVHGSNDPFCDIEDARVLCKQLEGRFITIKDGHHLGGASGVMQLPDLIDRLKQDAIL